MTLTNRGLSITLSETRGVQVLSEESSRGGRDSEETSSFDGGKSVAARGKREKSTSIGRGGEFPGHEHTRRIDGLSLMIDELMYD